MSLDLANLAIQTDLPHRLQLLHPITGAKLFADDSEEKPICILVLSEHSDAYKKAQRMAINRRLASSGTRRGNKMTAEELESDTLESIVACVSGWENFAFAGEELAYTPENARKILKDPKFAWIKEQVENCITDSSSFMKG